MKPFAHLTDLPKSQSVIKAMQRIREIRDTGVATVDEIKAIAGELETALLWCWEANRKGK